MTTTTASERLRDKGSRSAGFQRAMAFMLACIVPTLLAYNQPPSATLLNQCLAVALWGGVALVLAPSRWPQRTGWLLAALGVVMAGVAVSCGAGSLPLSLALQAAGLLAGAAVMVVIGAAAAQQGRGPATMAALAIGLLAAGLLGSGVALVQVFAPGWTDGNLIAIPAWQAGRWAICANPTTWAACCCGPWQQSRCWPSGARCLAGRPGLAAP